MEKVYQAEAYRYGALGSLGNAASMLIRQHQFPDEFDPSLDQMVGWDHDRIMQQDHDHGRRCFTQHTKTGELGFEAWVQRAAPAKVLAFLKDILRADSQVRWTGFRILGTVNRSNGYPVWTLQLFGKHPESRTVVYDTHSAPRLIHSSRYAHQ